MPLFIKISQKISKFKFLKLVYELNKQIVMIAYFFFKLDQKFEYSKLKKLKYKSLIQKAF